MRIVSVPPLMFPRAIRFRGPPLVQRQQEDKQEGRTLIQFTCDIDATVVLFQ